MNVNDVVACVTPQVMRGFADDGAVVLRQAINSPCNLPDKALFCSRYVDPLPGADRVDQNAGCAIGQYRQMPLLFISLIH